MKLPLQISFLGMSRSEAISDTVREKVQALERYCANIMSCRVTLEMGQKHQQQGRPVTVRIDLTTPGHELVVSRCANEDAYVALRDAFDEMRRQLEDTVRRRRGDEKKHALPLHGEVVRLDDGGEFGFIRTPLGDEYYFSKDNVTGAPFSRIQVGTPVQFIAEVANQGPQAKRVSLGKHHPA